MKLKQFIQGNTKIAELIRFGMVGGFCTVLQYGIYVVFVKAVKVPAVVSTLISYAISFIANFFLSSFFTFKSGPNAKKGLAFTMSHVINMGMQTGFVAIFKGIVGPTLALLPALAICVPLNYFMVRFAFKSKLFQSKKSRVAPGSYMALIESSESTNKFNNMSKVAFASDHAGYDLKVYLINYLREKGFETIDFGTHSTDSCDYPDYAHPAATAVENGDCAFGIAMCGTGNGIAMTLNKHQRIRAALAWQPEIAALARQHNDANILVLPARFVSKEEAIEIVDAYLNASFEGGRHMRRIEKIPVEVL